MALPHEPTHFKWRAIGGLKLKTELWFTPEEGGGIDGIIRGLNEGDCPVFALANGQTVIVRPLSPERKALRLARAA